MLPTELRTLGNRPFFYFTAPSFADIFSNHCVASSPPVFPSEKVELVSVFMSSPVKNRSPPRCATAAIFCFCSDLGVLVQTVVCVGPAIWILKRGGALRTISAGRRGAALLYVLPRPQPHCLRSAVSGSAGPSAGSFPQRAGLFNGVVAAGGMITLLKKIHRTICPSQGPNRTGIHSRIQWAFHPNPKLTQPRRGFG